MLSLIYTQSVIRHTNFLLAIWADKGWGPVALRSMFNSGRPTSLNTTSSEIHSYRLSTLTTVTRTTTASTLGQAHAPHLMHLHPHDRLKILEAMAATYSCLDFKRKEAYLLREVLAVVMDMLIAAREDRPNVRASVGLGLSMETRARMNGSLGGGGSVGVRASMDEAGNESLLRLVRYVCEVSGVDLEKVGISLPDKEGAKGSLAASDEDEDNVIMDPFGWPDLQLRVAREAMAIAEALPGKLPLMLLV